MLSIFLHIENSYTIFNYNVILKDKTQHTPYQCCKLDMQVSRGAQNMKAMLHVHIMHFPPIENHYKEKKLRKWFIE